MSKTTTYLELKKQIAELERQAEAARKAELAAIIADIRRKIAEHGLTAGDLGFGATVKRRARPATASLKVAAGRYRNPQTGEIYEYRGKGRKPAWLAAMAAEEIGHHKVG